MALTKLPKNALGTGSVDASKIEDGTIQTAELSGTVTADKLNTTLNLSSKTVTLPNTSVTSDMLANTTVANAKLSNSSITVRGTARNLGDTFTIGVDVDWQSVTTADGSTFNTAVSGQGYFIDTTSAVHTVTLPASASRGDFIAIKDYAGTFNTNNLTIARNGHNIQGVANDSLISTNRASLVLVYVDSTKGWLYWEEHNVASLLKAEFTEATGGTITTSGDFKIHSFTGDGCFVVSTLGNCSLVPTGGPSNVDYLVIAGGGGGGYGSGSGGGGGAGGYRTSFPSPSCNAGSFPITATTYPITVGAGGGGGSPSGNPAEPANVASTNGSNSIFSTITSAGGGYGGNGNPDTPVRDGNPGGSGGGASSGPFNGSGQYYCGNPGGTGNTPPVTPPQGNNGGTGYFNFGAPGASPLYQNVGGGGGGGAGGAGANMGTGGPAPGAAGGNGLANSITGSPVTRAGGGGGGLQASPSSKSGGAGGPGGGGQGSNKGDGTGPAATAGSANTGGGGGGASNGGCYSDGHLGAAGGKGIVIIRYKFQ